MDIIGHHGLMRVEDIQKLAEAHGLPPRASYTVRTLSKLLGIGKGTLYQACHAGRVQCLRVGKRLYVPLSEAVRLLQGEISLTDMESPPRGRRG